MSNEGAGAPSAILGFGQGDNAPSRSGTQRITLRGPGSILSFAPLGSDREAAILRPNLSAASCSAVVIDIDGASYTATADARSAAGQRVLRVDPFRLIGETTDAIDPFDLMKLEGLDQSVASTTLANLLFPKDECESRADARGFDLLRAVIGYLAAVSEKQSLVEGIRIFYADDTVYNLAVILDTIGGKIPPESYASIAAFLQLADIERTEILAAVQSRISMINSFSASGLASISPSSPTIGQLLEGDPFAIYLILPRARLGSHSFLLRLWIGALLQGLSVRPLAQRDGVLFLLDECQELGQFRDLEAAITLRWPAQALFWTIWQSIAQLRASHMGSWVAMVENSRALQVLGPVGYGMQGEAAALFETELSAVAALSAGDQLVRLGPDIFEFKA